MEVSDEATADYLAFRRSLGFNCAPELPFDEPRRSRGD